MALQWADFPSGQWGLYGTDVNKMLNGTPWVNTPSAELISDPDPAVGVAGIVLENPSAGSTLAAGMRLALTDPDEKIGVAMRVWITAVPSDVRPIVYTSTTSNAVRYGLSIRPNGGLQLRSGNSTVLAIADYPLLLANSWHHLEINADYVSGEVEVRKNGIAIPELTGTFAAPGGTCGHVLFNDKHDGAGTANYYRIKDLVVYNGDGSTFNSFLGTVTVNDLYPDGDDDLQWETSSGATGWNLIKDNTPGNRLTVSGSISNSETVTLLSTRYQFTSGSVDAGTPAGTTTNPWLVDLGATVAESLENLRHAINGTGTPGTTYSTALTANTSFECVGSGLVTLEIEPLNGTTMGQSCAEAMATASWASSTTFRYGPSDTSYVAAGFTAGPVYPDPSKFTFTDLDPNVTSVKGIMSIIRAYKTDGGDGNIQVSLSPNDVDWDVGTDTPLTTASTFYWNTSEVSPDTSAPWTPEEVDAILGRLDRTL